MQALYLVPRNQFGFAPAKKLGFSALINQCPSSFNSSALSVSRVVPNSFASRLGKSYERRNFVVRAEASSEEAAENVESAEAPEEPEAAETEAEAAEEELESEPEPPRKPIVKLGDIMGVFYLNFTGFLKL